MAIFFLVHTKGVMRLVELVEGGNEWKKVGKHCSTGIRVSKIFYIYIDEGAFGEPMNVF